MHCVSTGRFGKIENREMILNDFGNIVGAYKSLVANRCLKICKSRNEQMGKLWQRDYWEHIIRDYAAYQRIADYIVNNPASWNDDRYNTGSSIN